jgi:hypothetical protein
MYLNHNHESIEIPIVTIADSIESQMVRRGLIQASPTLVEDQAFRLLKKAPSHVKIKNRHPNVERVNKKVVFMGKNNADARGYVPFTRIMD